MDSALRPLPEPLRRQAADRLSTLALLIAAGDPVSWAEEHDDERESPRLALRVELAAARFCALRVESEQS